MGKEDARHVVVTQ